jgi:hypothetical protein
LVLALALISQVSAPPAAASRGSVRAPQEDQGSAGDTAALAPELQAVLRVADRALGWRAVVAALPLGLMTGGLVSLLVVAPVVGGLCLASVVAVGATGDQGSLLWFGTIQATLVAAYVAVAVVGAVFTLLGGTGLGLLVLPAIRDALAEVGPTPPTGPPGSSPSG